MPPTASEKLLRLHAYVDGELDAASALEMERLLDAEPSLAAERARLLAVREAIRNLPGETAPQRLRQAVLDMAGRPAMATRGRAPRAVARRTWLAMAASLLVGLGLGGGGTYVALEQNPGTLDQAQAAADAVLAGHVRALASGAPFDVASSDRHTVKPWFAGKLTFAPTVVDLAEDGFPLAGGRLDVIGAQTAATLVFRHDKHLISVTELIDPSGAYKTPGREARDGFSIVHWWENGIAYWAVSDAELSEVEALAAAFRKKVQAAPG